MTPDFLVHIFVLLSSLSYLHIWKWEPLWQLAHSWIWTWIVGMLFQSTYQSLCNFLKIFHETIHGIQLGQLCRYTWLRSGTGEPNVSSGSAPLCSIQASSGPVSAPGITGADSGSSQVSSECETQMCQIKATVGPRQSDYLTLNWLLFRVLPLSVQTDYI